MGVFSDAGLMFESHTAGGTNTRTCIYFFSISYSTVSFTEQTDS